MEVITWCVKGENEEEVAAKLAGAAAVSLDCAKDNGVAFDHGKTEAAHFRKSSAVPEAAIPVDTHNNSFNTAATRWLGI
jgi:hypothetical protein